ncbi:hypothetical protein RAS2_21800 [Phycisphaerae bacterium RAS2]|nr:hypothetical protein RAS2_21800 [Phycisphaerae bacterium RAS2]
MKLIVYAFCLATFAVGCTKPSVKFSQYPPPVPKAPIYQLNGPEDAMAMVRTDVSDAMSNWDAGKIKVGKTIAILPVAGPATSGDLLSTFLMMHLKQGGITVVERQVTRALLEEFELLKHSGEIPDDQLARLRKVIPADYFLATGVTSLRSETVSVALPERKLDPQDRVRYQRDYEEWRTKAIAYIDALDSAAQIFNHTPEYEEADKYYAWLFRNSLAKARRDIEATDFIGFQAVVEQLAWLPALAWPPFFNRDEHEAPATTTKKQSFDYSRVSPFGPYAGGGYRPLLNHLPEALPKSARRIEFELNQRRSLVIPVERTNASIAFRIIDTSTGEYGAIGVLEIVDNSETKALQRLAESLAGSLTAKLK